MSMDCGKINLTVKWARGILISMDWVKRKGTTAKRTMNPALYDELVFNRKKKIAEKVFEHKIHNELILNFDKTPVGFTCPGKTAFTEKNAETVPIDLCDPNVEFPKDFDITHSPNHWKNKETVMSLLKKIVFPFVNKKLESLSLSKNAKVLLIFDVFKGQTTPAVNDLLKDNNCIVQHVLNNHTNLFQPLDISVNKSAKRFISDKYQEWYA